MYGVHAASIPEKPNGRKTRVANVYWQSVYPIWFEKQIAGLYGQDCSF